MYPFIPILYFVYLSSSQANCTVVMDNMYTIEYKEECGRKYNKVSINRHEGDV